MEGSETAAMDELLPSGRKFLQATAWCQAWAWSPAGAKVLARRPQASWYIFFLPPPATSDDAGQQQNAMSNRCGSWRSS
jgi:hypothetical protein